MSPIPFRKPNGMKKPIKINSKSLKPIGINKDYFKYKPIKIKNKIDLHTKVSLKDLALWNGKIPKSYTAYGLKTTDTSKEQENTKNSSLRSDSKEDGCVCVKCREFFPYAEPNMEDGTLVCYSCRMDW